MSSHESPPTTWYLFHENTLFLTEEGTLPTTRDARPPIPVVLHEPVVWSQEQQRCGEIASSLSIPSGWTPISLRAVYSQFSHREAALAGRAFQIKEWAVQHQFCGQCGAPTNRSRTEYAALCSHCNRRYYPRISPAIIVAISREDTILLAHNARFPQNRYSLIAGFMEPGETPELTIRREVHEEVGITIDSICYVASQSHPFPDSLMLGFTARYAGGTIRPDGREILHADWFDREDLATVDLPSRRALSRALIEWVMYRDVAALSPFQQKNRPF
ncbi:NAD(+) diphosphatase [Chitinivibrio alkaliphilus]|uniref:NAD(+) diphosphatase n=1 Tax=Chitinivibrio alkaliphilus ACht1 TaxID=1313304 RepID=U7D5U2_9BACT|nr:NAD(+) diphosphatase [Chitinivibrio alkaliphilus]ERP31864.1 NADH pyrophosphatase, Nudix hydrolase superfamily [Chitinivibrio alkaliphilus ACht1]